MTDNTIWQQAGVVAPGGTVSAIAGSEALWLATEAGLFEQAGDGWQPLPQGQPLNQLSALSAQGQVLVAGNTLGQIVTSNNGGQSWFQARVGEQNAPITWITLLPDFAGRGLALAGTDGAGLLRSSDGGKSWQPANFGLQEFSVLVVAAPPAWRRRETVFAATPGGLYRSPNGGRAWKRFDAGLAGVVVQSLAVSPHFEADRTVLAGTESHGVYRSVNAGQSWEPANNGIGGDDAELPPINALWFGSTGDAAPDCVAGTGDGRLFHSADGGGTWRQVAAPGGAVLALGGDSRRLVAGLYRHGLLHSVDGGQSWAAVEGLAARNLTRLSAAGSGLVAFGPLGEVRHLPQLGQPWQPVALPDDSPLLTLATDGATLLAAKPAGLLRSGAKASGWETTLPGVEVLAARFGHDGAVWAGSSGGQVFASADGGQSWRECAAPQAGRPVTALALNGGEVVAATFGLDSGQITLWRSVDGGASWQQWHQAGAQWPAVNLAWLENTAVVCIDRRCWLSRAGGWERVLETDQPIVRLLQLPAGRGLLLLTSAQLFHSATGEKWADWGTGLPQLPLLDVALSPAGDGSTAATLLTTGGGLWQAAV
ncbi:MAG: hypothetical protein Kow0031_36640 [Anaerolineae bacterium]